MKRVGNIFDKMCSEETLMQAIINASKGKTKYKAVREVLRNIDYYVQVLQKMLLNETFTPSPYVSEVIKADTKLRLIKKLPFFPDRCIQHAIAIVMLPKWNKIIGNDTFASWKGRGINTRDIRYNFNHRVKNYINSHPLNKELYCLKFDISKCYQSVNNDLLDKMNEHYCKDKHLLRLMKKINHGDGIEGLAIGNYISQLWINVFLSKMDRYIKQELRCKQYVRYMDDCAIFSESKKQLHEWEHRIMNFLWYEMGLELNNKRQIFPIGRYRGQRSLDMCGYCFYRTFTLLRKRIKQHIKKKLSNPSSMASYKGILQSCDSINLIKSLGYAHFSDIGSKKDKKTL